MRRLIALSFGLLLLCAQAIAQTRTVTGVVTDAQNKPVTGASVAVKGTNIGTSTGADGRFSINVPANAQSLIISSVSYSPTEIAIGNRTTLTVQLTGNNAKLEEVVVVAYGNQVKKKVTGSVTTVSGEEFENRPFSSFDQMLQGRVPGLQSVAPTGQPGGLQQVRIRGIGSITAGAAPLYVVDGVPLNTGDFSRLNATSNALAGINPNDIESISVLKDAASASIYGARAANGVILITTKKGRAGRSKVRVDGEYGLSNLAFTTDLAKPLTRDEYFAITLEGLRNAGSSQATIDATLNTLGFNTTANEDWLGLVTRQGTTKNINASISGGDAKNTFYASAGFFDQEAVVIGSDYKRYSGTLNAKHRANEKIAINFGVTGSYSHQNTPNGSSGFRNPVFEGLSLRPSQRAYNPDGTVNFSVTEFNQLYNPLAIVQYDRIFLDNTKVIGNLGLDYQILKNLAFSSKVGIDYMDIEEERYDNPFFGDSRTVGGRIYNYDTRISNWVFTNILNYKHNFLGDNLEADLKVGYEAQKSNERRVTTRGEGVPTNTQIALPTPSAPSVANGARFDYTFASAFSLLQLNYQSKYSLSGSFRRDGSSRFGTNNKYGNFWSIGAAWNLDQENFMKGLTFVNALKLRTSYGVNGNGDIGNYTWRGSYTVASPYNNLPGSAPSIVDNPDLTWELNKPFNIGMDASLWNNRINFTVEYYHRKTEDLILAVPLSRTVGASGPTAATVGTVRANVGAMENKGWEFQFNIFPVRTKNLQWEVFFNISLNRNQILDLPLGRDIVELPYIRRVGQDFQSIYTRLWAGVDPATGDPLWYKDSSKQATTSVLTQVTGRGIIGSASPRGFGGFGTNIDFKGFSLSAQFNYQYGNYVYDQWGFLHWSDGFNPQLNKNRKQLQRWQKPGDMTDVPKYVYGGAKNSNAESSRWYYKGDFIRLRDLTLSYTVPKSILSKIKMDNARIYVRGSNLWTKVFDDRITFDPEQQVNGQNDMNVMIPRTISFGLSLGF